MKIPKDPTLADNLRAAIQSGEQFVRNLTLREAMVLVGEFVGCALVLGCFLAAYILLA